MPIEQVKAIFPGFLGVNSMVSILDGPSCLEIPKLGILKAAVQPIWLVVAKFNLTGVPDFTLK